MIRLLLALSLLFVPPAAAREVEEARFDVSLRGVTGARILWTAVTDGGGYAVSAKVETTGAVGWVARYAYDGQVRGRLTGDRARPTRYTETSRTPDGPERLVIEYARGVPRIALRDPEEPAQPWTLDPADMGGRVDPLTGLWLLLRAVDRADACRLDIRVYGGNRASRIVLANPQALAGGGIRCAGTVIPEGGFEPEEAADGPLAFTLDYDAAGAGLRSRALRFRSRLGDVVLTRR